MAESDRSAHWADVLATVLLSLAAVATAWATYQGAHWRSEQGLSGNRSTVARVQANRASGVANRQIQIDALTFTHWVDAYTRGDARLAAFYYRRFRPEFRPAVRAKPQRQTRSRRRAGSNPSVHRQTSRAPTATRCVWCSSRLRCSSQASVRACGRRARARPCSPWAGCSSSWPSAGCSRSRRASPSERSVEAGAVRLVHLAADVVLGPALLARPRGDRLARADDLGGIGPAHRVPET